MKRLSFLTLFLGVGTVLAGCGTSRSSSSLAGRLGPTTTSPSTTTTTTTSTTTSTSTTSTTTVPVDERPPHFDTPEEAMTYLAEAWNNDDIVSLRHVTNPEAREELDLMHEVATNLRLDRCDRNEAGDYTCFFAHDYPVGRGFPSGRPGEAVFLVGPADTPGWYMTVFKGCG